MVGITRSKVIWRFDLVEFSYSLVSSTCFQRVFATIRSFSYSMTINDLVISYFLFIFNDTLIHQSIHHSSASNSTVYLWWMLTAWYGSLILQTSYWYWRILWTGNTVCWSNTVKPYLLMVNTRFAGEIILRKTNSLWILHFSWWNLNVKSYWLWWLKHTMFGMFAVRIRSVPG